MPSPARAAGRGRPRDYVKTPDGRHLRFSHPPLMQQTQPGATSRASRPRDPGEHAIHTVGLCKRYGATIALDALDLTVDRGEVYGYLGPNGAGKTTTIRLLLGLHRPSAGRAELFGIDAWREPVAAHRHVAYVAGEPFLWPAMTSAETFEFLARLRGGADVAYRDVSDRALPARHREEDPCALQGQPPEGAADRRLRQPRRAAAARRAHRGSRPADGGRLPRHRPRSQAAWPGGLPLLAHPQRGRGAVRPRRHPTGRAPRRSGNARRSSPPQRTDRRGHLRRARARRSTASPASTSPTPGPAPCTSR